MWRQTHVLIIIVINANLVYAHENWACSTVICKLKRARFNDGTYYMYASACVHTFKYRHIKCSDPFSTKHLVLLFVDYICIWMQLWTSQMQTINTLYVSWGYTNSFSFCSLHHQPAHCYSPGLCSFPVAMATLQHPPISEKQGFSYKLTASWKQQGLPRHASVFIIRSPGFNGVFLIVGLLQLRYFNCIAGKTNEQL